MAIVAIGAFVVLCWLGPHLDTPTAWVLVIASVIAGVVAACIVVAFPQLRKPWLDHCKVVLERMQADPGMKGRLVLLLPVLVGIAALIVAMMVMDNDADQNFSHRSGHFVISVIGISRSDVFATLIKIPVYAVLLAGTVALIVINYSLYIFLAIKRAKN
jgi:nicotinamide riboside transporter PnuC